MSVFGEGKGGGLSASSGKKEEREGGEKGHSICISEKGGEGEKVLFVHSFKNSTKEGKKGKKRRVLLLGKREKGPKYSAVGMKVAQEGGRFISTGGGKGRRFTRQKCQSESGLIARTKKGRA